MQEEAHIGEDAGPKFSDKKKVSQKDIKHSSQLDSRKNKHEKGLAELRAMYLAGRRKKSNQVNENEAKPLQHKTSKRVDLGALRKRAQEHVSETRAANISKKVVNKMDKKRSDMTTNESTSMTQSTISQKTLIMTEVCFQRACEISKK